MNENQAGSARPFEPFRGVHDAYRDSMSKTMIDAVNSEDYAQTTGAMLDVYLTASALFREALEKSMVQALQNLSIPSRQELAALAERFTSLEMRLYDMDAKLDTLGNLL
jgi:polyhydroxyalkanoate synthesis regulator phasin